MNLAKSLVHRLGRIYCREICRREYESQQPGHINERPIEFRFVFEQLTRIKTATVLDVGTGTTALPHLIRNCGFMVTAIDNVRDYWPTGMVNRHYYVLNDDITKPRIEKRFDLITCISVLEHIRDHDAAMRSMFRLLNPGGHVVVTFPYNESRYVENVYKLPGAAYGQDLPYICQVFSRSQVDHWLRENHGTLLEQEYWQCVTGELWAFGESINPPRRVDKTERHQLSCLVMRGS